MKRVSEMRKMIRCSVNDYKERNADRIIKRLNDEVLRLAVENLKLKKEISKYESRARTASKAP